jgi:MoaA/NifB/PqqE/SkfB family radical SAM enzyme
VMHALSAIWGLVKDQHMRRSRISGGMLRTLFRSLVSDSAYVCLSKANEELAKCQRADTLCECLERSKRDLYDALRNRFSTLAAQALTLKIQNIFLARYHFRARHATVLSQPFGLVIDPSNMCRLACPGCVHSERSEEQKWFDWPNGTLSEQRLAALFKRYGPRAVGVYFCNYGEPLLNLQTPKFIRLAKRYLMNTALSTSLSVRRFEPEAYVESGLDFMAVSIDGATQAVYERFRRRGEIELALENLRRLLSARRKLKKRTPVLSWNFIAFEHNVHEIGLAQQMAERMGVDFFRVVNPFDVRWDDPEIRPAQAKGIVRRLNWFSMSNVPENWNPWPEALDEDAIALAFQSPWNDQGAELVRAEPGHTCHWLYKNMVMDSMGRILPCCGAPRPKDDLVFGSFPEEGSDSFNSEKYRIARSFFATGTAAASGPAPYCTSCEWDQTTVNVGGPEIRRYFRSVDAGLFDRRSLWLLSEW